MKDSVLPRQNLELELHERRWFLQQGFVCAVTVPTMIACTPKAPVFISTDVTGASFAKDLTLRDQDSTVRTMKEFNGKIVVVFFGFTQCPDVCPSSLTTLTEVKRLLREQGNLLQVLFVTVDPERDTQALLKEYMGNFDPTFLALRPEPNELQGVADDFKIYFKKVPGATPSSYTMDHSAGKYIFDTAGRLRLFSPYGTDPLTIANDIKTLMLVN